MTTATPDDVTPAAMAERDQRFAGAISGLKTKATTATAEKWFRLAGPVFMPLGALMIVLAWWGAANTTRLFLQIPYLISGGLLGLGFMFVGGFVYFARWMTDLLDDSQRRAETAEANADRMVEALERIERVLEATNASWYAEDGDTGAAWEPAIDASTFVSTENGKLAHLADCRLVTSRPTIVLTADDLATRARCRICQPDG